MGRPPEPTAPAGESGTGSWGVTGASAVVLAPGSVNTLGALQPPEQHAFGSPGLS